jgi:hypothetical protein
MLSFLRFLVLSLMFMFIYRVVVGAFRYIAGDDKKPPQTGPQPPREAKKPDAPGYQDVKDAHFKDLPPDSKSPS